MTKYFIYKWIDMEFPGKGYVSSNPLSLLASLFSDMSFRNLSSIQIRNNVINCHSSVNTDVGITYKKEEY